MRAQKIGLLGGSFNPAHAGHLYISETALRSLGLDQVWWLVSPQNPLKSGTDMAQYDARIGFAKKLAVSPHIHVSDFEKTIGETYTANTIAKLKQRYPNKKFVWLMGADNLVQIPKWYHWQKIFNQVPIAVFDRPGYCFKALSGKAANIFKHARRYPTGQGRPMLNFAAKTGPKWVFISHTKHKLSSTYIRNSCNNEGKACSSL